MPRRDGFKAINDEVGHSVGDAVLVEIAVRLRLLVRAVDVPARVGGDEFLVLLPDIEESDAHSVSESDTRALVGQAGVLALPWSVSVGTAWGVLTTAAELDSLVTS